MIMIYWHPWHFSCNCSLSLTSCNWPPVFLIHCSIDLLAFITALSLHACGSIQCVCQLQQIILFIQYPHFPSLAPSANHLHIYRHILSSQKSKEIYVKSSRGRSHIWQNMPYFVMYDYVIFEIVQPPPPELDKTEQELPSSPFDVCVQKHNTAPHSICVMSSSSCKRLSTQQ